MNKCEKCGFLHYRTDPCRKPKEKKAQPDETLRRIEAGLVVEPSAKSTEAKAGTASNQRGPQVAQAVEQGDASVIAQDLSCASSNLALPVDTNSLQSQNASSGNSDDGKPLTQTIPVKPRGRPSTCFDKRAYNKQYMADRRAGKR